MFVLQVSVHDVQVRGDWRDGDQVRVGPAPLRLAHAAQVSGVVDRREKFSSQGATIGLNTTIRARPIFVVKRIDSVSE